MIFKSKKPLSITAILITLGFVVSFSITTAFAYSSKRNKNVKIPVAGCYNGIFVEGAPASLDPVIEVENLVGKNFGTIMFYEAFTNKFPTTAVKNAIEHKSVPHISWEPWSFNDADFNINAVIDGKYDELIDSWAIEAKKIRKPMFIRIGHEMNGNWYPWAGATNDNNPQKYIEFYKYVVDKFKSKKVENVSFIWCPNVDSVPNETWNDYNNYYPGDKYVDWIGIDGYNWGTSAEWGSWKSFDEIFNNVYMDIVNRYPEKPIMIGEYASTELGGNKAEWIAETYNIIRDKYPSIKAVNWFNINKETDWRINSSSESLESFKNSINSEYFLGEYSYK